jgi:uncharacterized protein with PIN domain
MRVFRVINQYIVADQSKNVERFLVDQMLLRLGRWLRLVGLDVANPEESDDRKLVQKAKKENRALITRDHRLAEICKSAGVECILINSNRLHDQMKEMARYGIKLQLNPQRCTICNGILRETAKQTTCENSPFSIREKTWECEDCGKLYWEGSHWKKMEENLNKIGSGEY